LLIRQLLGRAKETVARVVDDDVDLADVNEGLVHAPSKQRVGFEFLWARHFLRLYFIGFAKHPMGETVKEKSCSLPDCPDSCGLETAVTGNQRKAEVECRSSDDTVGHVGNNIARNVLKLVGDVGVHGGDEQS
jgi:hypothetical protein